MALFLLKNKPSKTFQSGRRLLQQDVVYDVSTSTDNGTTFYVLTPADESSEPVTITLAEFDDLRLPLENPKLVPLTMPLSKNVQKIEVDDKYTPRKNLAPE